MATSKDTSTATIPAPDIKDMYLTLRGVAGSPFVHHAWDVKVKEGMLNKQMGKAANKKAPKDPWKDGVSTLYWMSPRPAKVTKATLKKAKFGFPSVGFKSAAVTACTSVGGMTKVAARQAFHVLGELTEIKGVPTIREDMVRVGMGSADIRHRAQFLDWEAKLHIRFNNGVISAEQLVHLFTTAGFAVGVGEWRPEKNGSWGMFEVDSKVQISD